MDDPPILTRHFAFVKPQGHGAAVPTRDSGARLSISGAAVPIPARHNLAAGGGRAGTVVA